MILKKENIHVELPEVKAGVFSCFLRLFSTDFENYFYFRLSSFMKSVKTHTAR